jgi:DNA helicase-2/ATP-dependent DNA helicase PcrA
VQFKKGQNPLNVIDKIIEDVEYRTYVDDGTDEGRDRWDNVMELRRLASEHQQEKLETFLESVTLVSDQDTLDASANVPTLLTLHSAKGLEFPVVFIVGLNDGTLPHIRSFDDQEAMEEERRLLYVGITRAKDQLFLLHTFNRYLYGYSEPAQPSRFLLDIPNQMVNNDQTLASSGSNMFPKYQPEKWESTEPAPKMEKSYNPGAQVVHSLWGQGLVLTSKLENDDEIVDVFFESVGLKRVVASVAKLEIKS